MAFVDENFGINVFNDSVMRQRLPKETYKTLHKTIDEGRRLDPQYLKRERELKRR